MDFIKKQQKKLKKRKKELEKELKSFAKKDFKLKGNWITKYPDYHQGADMSEEADEVEQYAESLPVEHILELELKKVNQALENIEKGKYGICNNCKKKIKKQRLEVYPEADSCLECEKKEK